MCVFLSFYHTNSAAPFVANVAFCFVSSCWTQTMKHMKQCSLHHLQHLAPSCTSLNNVSDGFSVRHPISVAFPWQCRRTSPGKKNEKSHPWVIESSAVLWFYPELQTKGLERDKLMRAEGKSITKSQKKHLKFTCFCHFAWEWVESLSFYVNSQSFELWTDREPASCKLQQVSSTVGSED